MKASYRIPEHPLLMTLSAFTVSQGWFRIMDLGFELIEEAAEAAKEISDVLFRYSQSLTLVRYTIKDEAGRLILSGWMDRGVDSYVIFDQENRLKRSRTAD